MGSEEPWGQTEVLVVWVSPARGGGLSPECTESPRCPRPSAAGAAPAPPGMLKAAGRSRSRPAPGPAAPPRPRGRGEPAGGGRHRPSTPPVTAWKGHKEQSQHRAPPPVESWGFAGKIFGKKTSWNSFATFNPLITSIFVLELYLREGNKTKQRQQGKL